MSTGVEGRDDASFRARHAWPAIVAMLLLLASLLSISPRPTGVVQPAAADDSSTVLGYDDASAAALGRKQYLRLTSKVLGAPLAPGFSRTLRVSVKNPYPFALRITSIKAVTRSTSKVGCSPRWFTVKAFKTTSLKKALPVKARKSATKNLAITFVNLPTVNQDACKQATYRLALSAVARRA
jgi:hypothetical protein